MADMAKGGLLITMMVITAATVTMSGIRVVTLSDIMSFRELTSPIILARIFPVGRPSKKESPRDWIWVYSSSRIVSTISLEISAIMTVRILTPKSQIPLRARAPSPRRNSPLISPPATWTLTALSMRRGFNRAMAMVTAMMHSTAPIFFL